MDDRDQDWEDRRPEASPTSRLSTPAPTPTEDHPTDDRRDEPPAASRRSSVYSYSSQTPRNAAVGRAEAVYDAEYRVIIPPYRDLSADAIADDYADDQADAPVADQYDEDPYNETNVDLGEDDVEDEEADDDAVLGDEVFDDWETEANDGDWSRR